MSNVNSLLSIFRNMLQGIDSEERVELLKRLMGDYIIDSMCRYNNTDDVLVYKWNVNHIQTCSSNEFHVMALLESLEKATKDEDNTWYPRYE